MGKIRPNVSSDWQRASLKDVLDVESNAVTPVAGTTYNYVGLEHIEQHTGALLAAPETEGGEIASTKYYFDPTHVLYGRLRPNLNKVALPNCSGICSTDILPLAPKPSVLREYVAFYLRTPTFIHWAVTNATGTKMPRIGINQFLAALIPVPPLPVQHQIVAILQKADDVLRKHSEALELANAILSASFITMFGNPLMNGERYRREHLGIIADVKSGVTKGRRLQGKETVEVSYLRVANVQDGFLDLDEIKTIKVLPGDCEKYQLENGDILMTEGGDPDKLGRGSIWRNELADCIYQNHVFRVRADRTQLLPEYLAALLRTQYAKRYFFSCAKRTSNLASINSTQVKAFTVPVPPLVLQRRFVMAADQWERTADRLKVAHKRVGAMFQALLCQAFGGELTADFERENTSLIQELQNFDSRLPALVALAVLNESVDRRERSAAELALSITTLMVLVFLVQMKRTTKRRFYGFVPYRHGPFAKELYADLEKFQQDGLIGIDNSDEDTTRVTLTDSDSAKKLTDELPEEVREDIRVILDDYGGLKRKDLVDRVYEEFPAYVKKSRLKRVARRQGTRRTLKR